MRLQIVVCKENEKLKKDEEKGFNGIYSFTNENGKVRVSKLKNLKRITNHT